MIILTDPREILEQLGARWSPDLGAYALGELPAHMVRCVLCGTAPCSCTYCQTPHNPRPYTDPDAELRPCGIHVCLVEPGAIATPGVDKTLGDIENVIRGLPEGFEHPIRERGSGLSTGQKQLISFARALAHNPRYLILDEATSSVDTETEFRVRDALSRMVEGRTSIIIAHRLSTIQRADRILVMHKGKLRESGTHQELLAERGIYWKLYQLQYKDQEIGVPQVGD